FLYAPLIFLITPQILVDSQKMSHQLNAYGDLPPDSVLVLLNPPAAFPIINFYAVYYEKQQTVPKQMRLLYAGTGILTVTRPDELTLRLRAEHGFLQPAEPVGDEPAVGLPIALKKFDHLLYSQEKKFEAGYTYPIEGMAVTVLDVTDDGRPLEV